MCARAVEFDEKAEFGHAADPGFEDLPNLARVISGKIAVLGAALSVGGLTLAIRNGFGQGDRCFGSAQRFAAFTETKGMDQRPVNGQVGVATDRAGEMRVARLPCDCSTLN